MITKNLLQDLSTESQNRFKKLDKENKISFLEKLKIREMLIVYDQLIEVREEIQKVGTTVEGESLVRVHPLVKMEQDLSRRYTRLLTSLHLWERMP